MQNREFLRAAVTFEEAAEFMKNFGESPSEYYEKAGNAYMLFAKSMAHFRNKLKAKEGYENAISCLEKAGKPINVEEIGELSFLRLEERKKQVEEELVRLRADFEEGLLPKEHYTKMEESYHSLLNQLKVSLSQW